jgi:hypothetical protein
MKKFLLFFLMVSVSLLKAQSASKIFEAKEIVWYGLDFTKAKFVGAFDQAAGVGAATGMDIKTKWIPSWNNLIASEPQNFDLRKTFRIDNVIYALETINDVNKKVDPDNCMSFNEGKMEKAEIENMIKAYKTDKKDGIGLVFAVQNFNKTTGYADVYVTFFDIASRKVLLCELTYGKAMGIGMRNFWAGAIKSILKQIEKIEYGNWKRNNK